MPLILTRRLQPLHGVIDLVPVVTVVLLLLCFFLLSSSFVLQPGIKVDPPRSEFSEGTPSSRLIVAVAMSPAQVDANGNPMAPHPVLFFNDQIVTLDGLRTSSLDRLPVGREHARARAQGGSSNVPLERRDRDHGTSAFAHRLSIHLATAAWIVTLGMAAGFPIPTAPHDVVHTTLARLHNWIDGVPPPQRRLGKFILVAALLHVAGVFLHPDRQHAA